MAPPQQQKPQHPSPQPSREISRDALAAEIYVNRLLPNMPSIDRMTVARQAIEAADDFLAELNKKPTAVQAA